VVNKHPAVSSSSMIDAQVDRRTRLARIAAEDPRGPRPGRPRSRTRDQLRDDVRESTPRYPARGPFSG
jgi:hypothetical protein